MLHKDLIGEDLHVTKLHAPTHLVGGTDPLGLAESEITGLVTDLSGKAPTVHSHVKADITDFPTLGTAAALNVDADIATLALPANTTITAAGAAILDDADAAAQRTTLGTAAYSEGTWAPVLNSFTIVGSAPATSGIWKRIGNLIFVTCTISAGSGGNTSVACTTVTSYISGLPLAPALASVCMASTDGTAFNTAVGFVFISGGVGGGFFPASFPATTTPIIITSTYTV